MTGGAAWSLAIAVPPRQLAGLTARLLELGFPSLEERRTPAGATILVYASDPTVLEALQHALAAAPGAGVDAERLRFELTRVSDDWALEWTRHLTPVALTPSLTLYPERPSQPPGPGELYLEPAFAFGFGEHASTRLAARWIESACRAAPVASVLDVGCGTGVLALVARRSGAARVLGVDISAAAVASARANAALNAIDGLTFLEGGLERAPGEFERVIANIEAPILCSLAPGIASRLAPSGELGLAGLILEQADEVIAAFAAAGVRLELREVLDDWCLLAGGRGISAERTRASGQP